MKSWITLFCLLALSLSEELYSEPIVQPLWPEGPPLGENATAEDPQLTIYLPKDPTGAAVVIFPGGGYWGLAMDHEGHQVAQWLNSFGVAGIIVSYRRGPGAEHPVPLLDAQHAIRTVRHNADAWQIDPVRVGVLGFSAGGHLASSTGVHFDNGDAASSQPIKRQSCRPDFMVLVYPVISMTRDYMHAGSKRNLLGDDVADELAREMSSDLQVTAETPPTFLILTDEDTAVPAENSIYFYLALRRAGVPGEMHIFEKGQHGFGLGQLDHILSGWMGLCQKWMGQRGLLTPR
ncbi:alpha/beta hydrolase [candidate division KSB1 bacterium]|nr:alpha/beta hydrolase [candidate division KSB1 bacterium]RQW06490.1 MAG: alpha/beta hydrolase [candidate division KSB1 bacterium]